MYIPLSKTEKYFKNLIQEFLLSQGERVIDVFKENKIYVCFYDDYLHQSDSFLNLYKEVKLNYRNNKFNILNGQQICTD